VQTTIAGKHGSDRFFLATIAAALIGSALILALG
jgi:hypothetical protein